MRLFVALDIPEDVRTSIGALMAKLRDACRSARWVRTEGLHITLKFIGEVPAEKSDEIKASLQRVPFPSPFEISFRGLAFFPHERRPHVLYSGIDAGPELGALATAVEAELEPLGIPREQRAFSPHLTFSRFDSPKGLERLHAAIAAAGPLEFGTVIAKEFHLYQSILKHGGAEYTRLASFGSGKAESQ